MGAEVFNSRIYRPNTFDPASCLSQDVVGAGLALLLSRPDEASEIWNGVERDFTKEILGSARNVFHITDQKFKISFQENLKKILEQISNQVRTLQFDEVYYNLLSHQILSLIPFAYPEEGFEFYMPVQVNGKWSAVEYRLDKRFSMGNSLFPSPLYAYGFVPKTDIEAPPLLVFTGTTYPAGSGFMETVMSDFTPFSSVGTLPMSIGREEIADWLGNKRGVHTCGISLGASLAIKALKEFPKSIERVDAISPAGLYCWELEKFKRVATKINIYFQQGDYVPKFGYFPNGSHIFHIEKIDRVKPNYGLIPRLLFMASSPISSHATVYATSKDIKISERKTSKENHRLERHFFTAIQFVGSPFIFLFLFVVQLVNCSTRKIFHTTTPLAQA